MNVLKTREAQILKIFKNIQPHPKTSRSNIKESVVKGKYTYTSVILSKR